MAKLIQLIAVASVFVVAVVPIILLIGRTSPAISRIEAQNQMLLKRLDEIENKAEKSQQPKQMTLQSRRSVELQQKETTKSDNTLPSKWAAKYLTPRYNQEDRGTCWDFGTIGFLEASYRSNGVKKGLLAENQYTRFNEQAYGLSVIEACRGHPDVCDVVGDFVYHNSTEGGEVWWLYSLTSLYDKLLPSSVCPYMPDHEHEHVCPGMDAAIASNPIKFDISAMETAYSVEDTKKLMVSKEAALAWSSEMHQTVYYFPCNDAYWSTQPECRDITKSVQCPTDRNYNSDRCVRITSSMFTLDGEFYMHGPTIPEGGHAMNVVGYNDEFVTKDGSKGGFIIKNSWHDLLYGKDTDGRGARGSHSVAYWMQQISAWDEKMVCPGPLNPENWISCVEMEAGPSLKMAIPKQHHTVGSYDISQTCLDDGFMKNLLDVSLQPTEFVCTDPNFCSTEARYRYFMISYERTEQLDLASVCMLQYDIATGNQVKICTPKLIPGRIAYIFTPTPQILEKLKNNDDLCGYWFWPYDMLYKQTGLFKNFYSTYFDVEWYNRSYITAQEQGYDYSWLQKSTKTIQTMDFPTPSPFATKRY